jgi:signal recognition particle subunit SRP72
MAASSLTSLSSLLQRSNLDDDEEVLNACNAALKKSKTDLEAQRVKVIALLKLDRFDDALRVLQDGGHNLQDRTRLEFAYAQYKSGNLEEAAELASQIPTQRGARHVEAQAVFSPQL